LAGQSRLRTAARGGSHRSGGWRGARLACPRVLAAPSANGRRERIMISRFFIDRPIFAAVLSIVIVLAGGVAYTALPIAQYPDVTPPTVQVTAAYPGANAQTVYDTVAAPIEEQ